jgi:hypothetical protein
MKVKGEITWREDASNLTFEEFYKFHDGYFDDELEAKQVYKKVTGKDPTQKPKAGKKTANTTDEAE